MKANSWTPLPNILPFRNHRNQFKEREKRGAESVKLSKEAIIGSIRRPSKIIASAMKNGERSTPSLSFSSSPVDYRLTLYDNPSLRSALSPLPHWLGRKGAPNGWSCYPNLGANLKLWDLCPEYPHNHNQVGSFFAFANVSLGTTLSGSRQKTTCFPITSPLISSTRHERVSLSLLSSFSVRLS